MNKPHLIYSGSCFEIEWYVDDRGNRPCLEFFEQISSRRQAAFLALAIRLADSGKIWDESKFRNEGKGLYVFKPQPERCFCFFYSGRKVIVTNGYTKKKQKRSKEDVEKAREAKASYTRRVLQGSYYEENS